MLKRAAAVCVCVCVCAANARTLTLTRSPAMLVKVEEMIAFVLQRNWHPHPPLRIACVRLPWARSPHIMKSHPAFLMMNMVHNGLGHLRPPSFLAILASPAASSIVLASDDASAHLCLFT